MAVIFSIGRGPTAMVGGPTAMVGGQGEPKLITCTPPYFGYGEFKNVGGFFRLTDFNRLLTDLTDFNRF